MKAVKFIWLACATVIFGMLYSTLRAQVPALTTWLGPELIAGSDAWLLVAAVYAFGLTFKFLVVGIIALSVALLIHLACQPRAMVVATLAGVLAPVIGFVSIASVPELRSLISPLGHAMAIVNDVTFAAMLPLATWLVGALASRKAVSIGSRQKLAEQ